MKQLSLFIIAIVVISTLNINFCSNSQNSQKKSIFESKSVKEKISWIHSNSDSYSENDSRNVIKENNFINFIQAQSHTGANLIMKGWVRYLIFDQLDKHAPTAFKKNTGYAVQKFSQNNEDSFIPKEDYFYFELSSYILKVFTSNNVKNRRMVDLLAIRELIPLSQTLPFHGSVEDVGNFKEGYCFLLKVLKDKKKQIWEICTPTLKEKDNWMQSFIRLKIKDKLKKEKKKADSCKKKNKSKNKNKSFTIINYLQKKDYTIPKYVSNIDSILPPKNPMNRITTPHWTYLSNWSTCSKPCGLGFQTIHRSCEGKGHCIGDKYLTRPCEIKKCSFNSAPVIEPQSQCNNFKGLFDLLNGSGHIASRVEFNKNNIEIFELHESTVPLAVLTLSNLQTIRDSRRFPGCIKLADNSSKIRLCNGRHNYHSHDWIRRIVEYKRRCSNPILNKLVNFTYVNSLKQKMSLIRASKCVLNKKRKVFTKSYCNSKFQHITLKKVCNRGQFCYMCCAEELGQNASEKDTECCHNSCDEIKPKSEYCRNFNRLNKAKKG